MNSFIKHLTTIHVAVAYASVASSKPKVELDLHADRCVVGDNCLIIHDHERQVNVGDNCLVIHDHSRPVTSIQKIATEVPTQLML